MRDLPELFLTCFYALVAAVVAGIHLRSYAENYVALYDRIDSQRFQDAVELSFDLGIAFLACWFVLTWSTSAIRIWLDPDQGRE